MSETYVEKWLQLWADSAKPVSARVYKLRITVPAELIGEAEAIASDTEKKNGHDDDKQQYHENIGRIHYEPSHHSSLQRFAELSKSLTSAYAVRYRLPQREANQTRPNTTL